METEHISGFQYKTQARIALRKTGFFAAQLLATKNLPGKGRALHDSVLPLENMQIRRISPEAGFAAQAEPTPAENRKSVIARAVNVVLNSIRTLQFEPFDPGIYTIGAQAACLRLTWQLHFFRFLLDRGMEQPRYALSCSLS
jgi:hypothetical protein